MTRELTNNNETIERVIEAAVKLILSGCPLDNDPYDLIVGKDPFHELGEALEAIGALEPTNTSISAGSFVVK